MRKCNWFRWRDEWGECPPHCPPSREFQVLRVITYKYLQSQWPCDPVNYKMHDLVNPLVRQVHYSKNIEINYIFFKNKTSKRNLTDKICGLLFCNLPAPTANGLTPSAGTPEAIFSFLRDSKYPCSAALLPQSPPQNGTPTCKTEMGTFGIF